jgi:hypothetical protein
MCPATGALTVAGWEADGQGSAARVTAITSCHLERSEASNPSY